MAPGPRAARRNSVRGTSGARVFRIGHRAVVALPDAGLVARVNRPDHAIQSLQAEMDIARYLERAGLPVSAPADDVRETAVATPDGAVSFWLYLHSVGSNYDPRWLGQTLRRLHGLAFPPHLVSLWDPVTRAEQRLTRYAARADARRDSVAHLSDVAARAKEGLPCTVIPECHRDGRGTCDDRLRSRGNRSGGMGFR